MKRKAWLTVAAALLLPVTALAAETFDGTVVAGVTTDVTASFGGTVQSVSVREGAYLAVGDVAAVLDRFDLRSMFGGITKEELLDLMFHIDA